MRTILTIAASALLLTGCADKEAYQAYMLSFDKAAEGYYLAATEPLLSVELPSPVKDQPYKIVVNREVKPLAPQQIKDSEWVPAVSGLINATGVVGGIWATGEATSKIIGAASSGPTFYGPATVENSFTEQTTSTIGQGNNPAVSGTAPGAEPILVEPFVVEPGMEVVEEPVVE